MCAGAAEGHRPPRPWLWRLGSGLLLASVALAGCASSGPTGDRSGGAPGGPAPAEARPLVIIVRVEPASLATRPFQQPGTALHVSRRLFNALPALIDDRATPRPQLLETRPQLDTDTWRVFPDGRMETSYQLRPNLRWHDGQALTAEDFVFAWRVYATPDFGHANRPPLHAIEEVAALDPLRFAIRWKLPYPDASTLSARDRELPAVPRHLLQGAFDQIPASGADALAAHPFWSREYVGLGPYRLERWEPGAFSEAVYGGQAIFADTMIWSGSEWGGALDASITTYPYDLRRTEALMGQAGYARGPDGVYGGPEGRFAGELQTTEGPDNVPEMLIMAARLREAGFDVREHVLPAAQAQDSQARATFSTLQTSNTNMGEPAMINLVSEQIPGPGNRWRGGNRGGWSAPDYDRLVGVFNRTLDRDERLQLVRQLLRIYGEDLPAVPLFFRAQPFAHVAALRGPAIAAPESSVVWNVHEWEFR